MTNNELEKILKEEIVPEPRAGFWDELPADVERSINRGISLRSEDALPSRGIMAQFFSKAALPLSFVAICVTVAFLWGANSRKTHMNPGELAEARACWREVTTLFPNQLQSIAFDQQGSRIVLAEKPNQPSSPPIFLKMCDAQGCKRFVTFSGQLIKVNGENFEVLIDLEGEVLLVGDAKVWKSSKKSSNLGDYKVFAQSLATS